MKWIGPMSGVALAAAAAMTVSGCSNSGSDSSSDSSTTTITVYNAQHESLTTEWADAFTAETGIGVQLRNGSDTELGNQLVAEGDKSPADVFLTENSPAMTLVENAGLFADVHQDVLDQVPSEYRPSSGKWTGIAARSTVFAYNKATLPRTSCRRRCSTCRTPRGRTAGRPRPPEPTSRPSSALCSN